MFGPKRSKTYRKRNVNPLVLVLERSGECIFFNEKQVKRQRDIFSRERARAVSERKKRLLTGDAWELRADAVSKLPFWYNRDTGAVLV